VLPARVATPVVILSVAIRAKMVPT